MDHYEGQRRVVLFVDLILLLEPVAMVVFLKGFLQIALTWQVF